MPTDTERQTRWNNLLLEMSIDSGRRKETPMVGRPKEGRWAPQNRAVIRPSYCSS